MKPYIDIHSHGENSNATSIVNCFPLDIETALNKAPQHYFSVGLHPWYIKADYQKELDIVIAFGKNPQVLAIGETGLDKLCDNSFELQRELFILQAKVAENVQKPLIIHCVKAYSEIMQLKKELRPSVPWILHGYRGNKEITQQLLAHDFYFSLGKGIPLLQESIKIIPLNRLFLETDEGENTIEEVYTLATEGFQIKPASLQHTIELTFKKVFLKSH